MRVRIYCSECGFLNIEMKESSGLPNECMSCLKGLSPKGMLKNLDITIEYCGYFIVRKGASFQAIKKDIEILEKNKSVIRGIIQRIKKKESGRRRLGKDDQITDLLKQVLKKDMTPEKIGLEKGLRNTKRGLAHLRQELERKSSPIQLLKEGGNDNGSQIYFPY